MRALPFPMGIERARSKAGTLIKKNRQFLDKPGSELILFFRKP
jgi:hypothetical protein